MTVVLVVSFKVELLSVQLPVVPVMQLLTPPGTKLPLTVALGTTALVLVSRIVTITLACQFFPVLVALPDRDFTATFCFAASLGAPAASEKASRFLEPAPMELRRPAVALLVRKATTAAGDAAGLAAKASAATPATWGAAMEVPLKVLIAVALVFQADVMLVPGAKISRQVP